MAVLIGLVTSFLSPAKTSDDIVVPDTLEREVELQELIVNYKRQKYSKKNNPAVDFVNLLRERSEADNPNNREYFSYDRYGRLTLALCPFDSMRLAQGSLSFLKEHTDSSPISGRPMLPISVKEKSSTVFLTDYGNNRKEIIEAVSRNGVDEIANQEGVERILEDVLREIDLYQNDIPLFRTRFVSPLSKIGPDFYQYYLTDTIIRPDGARWIELSFTPRVNTTNGFTGRLYVEEGDSTMFVHQVRMSFPSHININYVDKISIEQTFERAPDGTRIKTVDDLQAELRILPGIPGFYARRLSLFTNPSLETPDSATLEMIGTIVGETYTNPDAVDIGMSRGYWETVRETTMTEPQKNMGGLMANLRGIKGYRYIEKALKILATGYIPSTGDFNTSKFDFGPIFNILSHNDLEGWRYQIGGMTTTKLSKRWFMNGYVAYGNHDRKFKEQLAVEYSFIDKEGYYRNFPIRSVAATFTDDVYYPGQKLNAYGMLFQSIQRNTKSLIAYRREGKLTYTHERSNHLSWTVTANYSKTSTTPLMFLRRSNGDPFGHYNTLESTVSLRWAPGEKIYESPMLRSNINKDNLILEFTVNAGRVYTPWTKFNKLSIDVSTRKRVWLSAFGYFDFDVAAGKIFGKVPYPELATLPVSTSILIVDGTFSVASPMEFIGDLYGRWDVKYNGQGILFDRLPLIKKLKIREIIGLRGWWSKLNGKNNPDLNNDLFKFPYDSEITHMPRPYMELYAGLDNILSIFRIDWVYRVNYRHVPDCDRWGIRIALHFTF